MTAIILAGAKRSLSNEIYPELPTCLIPVANKPFLFWLTRWVKEQGFNQLVYCAGMHEDNVDAWITEQSSSDSEICYDVVGESRPRGTAGATLLATKRFPADLFLVVNGDSLLLTDLGPCLEKLENKPELDGIILASRAHNAGRFGNLEINSKNELTAFKEKKPGNGLINAGVYLLRQSLFESMETDKELSLEYDCFPQWLSQGKTFEVVETKCPFIDIGTPESLSKAEDLIAPYCQRLQTEAEI